MKKLIRLAKLTAFFGSLFVFTAFVAAAWDSTKPSQTQTVSQAISSAQGNFAAIEAGTQTMIGTASSAFAIAEGGNISGCTTNKLADDGACFEGDTSDGVESKILITDPTSSDKTLTIPNANSVTLPSGALFFMVTGSCPAGTTDVTATYSDKFVRINATGGSTAGSDTHTHSAGSYAGPSHTHQFATSGTSNAINTANAQTRSVVSGGFVYGSGGSETAASLTDVTQAGGTGSVTGTSASGSNVPAYVTAKACQVD